MHFFIDESGKFTKDDGISVVCSLAIPSGAVPMARAYLSSLTKDWPRVNGELKSGSLTLDHLKALTDALYRSGAVLHCIACNVAAEYPADVAAHKAGQCEGMTKHLTDEHAKAVVSEIWKLRKDLEGMPQQLYIQSVAMRELVSTAVEEVSMYYAQRKPGELGSFIWTIDAKDHTKITTQENWWKLTLGPLIETGSERDPFLIGTGPEFDYSHFDRAFGFEHELWRPGKERVKVRGLDIKRMLLENLSFVDSRSDILVQAVDILAGALRRALQRTSPDLLQRAYQLGRLQIARKRGQVVQAVQFFSLSKGRLVVPTVMDLIREMAKTHRSMRKR